MQNNISKTQIGHKNSISQADISATTVPQKSYIHNNEKIFESDGGAYRSYCYNILKKK